jgi:hypothetical protein
MDDFVIYGNSIEKAMENLENVLIICHKNKYFT